MRKDNNRTNHPPRPASHPWKSGAAYRQGREQSISERKVAKEQRNGK